MNAKKKWLIIGGLTSSILLMSFSIEGSFFPLDGSIHEKTDPVEMPVIKISGVKVFVGDLERAKEFYVDFLGLSAVSQAAQTIELSTGQYPIFLIESDNHITRDLHSESHYGISFLVNKLMPAIDHARQSGYQLYDTLLSRNGVGIHVPIADPTGNLLHLMEVQIRKVPKFEGYRLYNSGMVVNDMAEAEVIYKEYLGFQDWSRNYLPDALPLKHSDGSFAFMLHENKDLSRSTYTYGAYPGTVLVLETVDLQACMEYLDANDVEYRKRDSTVLVKDSNANTVEIISP